LLIEGDKLNQAGNYSDASGILELAVKFDPYLVPAYEALGLSLHKLKEYQRSIGAWKKAIELGSDNFNTYYGLGMVYLDQGNWKLAENKLNEALNRRVKPSEWTGDYTDAYYNLGRSIVEGGRAADEISTLGNRLKYGDKAEDRFKLAILYLWLGNGEKVMLEHNQLDEKNSIFPKLLD
jgi:tetratricopeptide (TPR) repeat protein